MKLKFAFAVAASRILIGNPLAAIPNNDLSRAVLLRWNHAFEIGVIQRMIFHVYRQAFVFGIQARTLGHRPAFQHTL